MSAGFRFESEWVAPCGRAELWRHLEHLLESEDPMIWWPSVETITSVPGRLSLRAQSRFGYSLDFHLTDLVLEAPELMRFGAEGDLTGNGVVMFEERGPMQTAMLIDWQVDMSHTWLRRATWLLRPVFTLAHHKIMQEGQGRLGDWIRARD